MPIDVSHFTMAGFAIDTHTESAFLQTAEKFTAACAPQELSKTELLCTLKDPSGGELTIGIRRNADGSANIVTVDPSFSGEGRTAVEIDADVSAAADKPFDLSYAAHLAEGQTPLVVQLADPRDAARLAPGAKAELGISAFSFEPKLFADESAYYAAQAGAKVHFAADFFIPSGSIYAKGGGAMPDDAKTPIAYADFAGKVLKAELRRNAAGAGQFWWALVQTGGGATFDVLMDPRSVAGTPKPGAIVSGRFWLSAHVRQE